MRFAALTIVAIIAMTSLALAASPSHCGGCKDTCKPTCKSDCGGCKQKCYPAKPCEPVCKSKCKPKAPSCGECCDDPWTEGFNEIPVQDCVSALPDLACCPPDEFCLLHQVCWDLKFDECCQPSEFRLLCKPVKCEPVKCGKKCKQDTCTPRPGCGSCGDC